MNWFDIEYLLQGNERQKAAYHVLNKLRIFEDLADYSPVLVGTIPLGIDIPSSDLDILLEAQDLQEVAEKLETLYQPDTAHFGKEDGSGYFVAKLEMQRFEIEFFAQNKATIFQNGYRHMVIEARLLDLAGDEVRELIRRMKLAGMKTEPAFGRYFGIEGNPYDALLELERWDDAALRELISRKPG
jgi:hypothetical protein